MTALVVLHRICLAVQFVCAILFVVEAVASLLQASLGGSAGSL
jgi:hypothetical protein